MEASRIKDSVNKSARLHTDESMSTFDEQTSDQAKTSGRWNSTKYFPIAQLHTCMERSISIYSSKSHFNGHSYKDASPFNTFESLGKNLGTIDNIMINSNMGWRQFRACGIFDGCIGKGKQKFLNE